MVNIKMVLVMALVMLLECKQHSGALIMQMHVWQTTEVAFYHHLYLLMSTPSE